MVVNKHNFIKFFDIYLDFQNKIHNNILLINQNEIGIFNPITLCYRPFYNIDLFRFKYNLMHTCTGICQFSKNKNKIDLLFTSPFLDFIEDYIDNNNINSIEDFINRGIFATRNVLCNENECIIDNAGSVQTLKYQIIEYPFIISINISMNYNTLKINNNKIIKLFNQDFMLNDRFYYLVGIVLMPSEDHFICIFKNFNTIFNMQLNSWYIYDDLNGNIKYYNNYFLFICYKNIIFLIIIF